MFNALGVPLRCATLRLALQRFPCLKVLLPARLLHCCQEQGNDESSDFPVQPTCHQVKIRRIQKVADFGSPSSDRFYKDLDAVLGELS